MTVRAEPSDYVADRIAAARSFRGIPFEKAPLPFESLREMGAVQRDRLATAPYLVAYDHERRRVELTHAGFWTRVRALSVWMSGELGLEPGQRVATLAHNSLEAALTSFAAFDAGLVLVPCNMTEDAERLGFVLENSEARALFVLEPYLERGTALAAQLGIDRRVQLSGTPASGYRRPPFAFEGGAGAEAAARRAEGDGRRPESALDRASEAVVVYTSGTTGAPKGVVLTHGNLLADAAGIAAWHGLERGQRMMCVLPIHHVNGLVVTLVTPQVFGGSVVLNGRFQTEHFWRRAAAERVQVVSVVPTLLAFLLERPELFEAEGGLAGGLSGLRHIICGAGPLTVELAARFEDRFGVPIVHGYGLSETTCFSSFLPADVAPEEHRGWMRDHGFPSIGIAIPPNEMAIHDGEGRAVRDGERGEIVIRGHNVMKGYFGRPEANAEAFAHGWFRSGDEGFRKQGYYFITGRIKELIIRGGVNLSPLEIDEVLNRVPGVAVGLAVGFANDWYGEEVGAYVKRAPDRPDVTEADVLAACVAALPFHKRPKVVVFGEEIPVTSTGKYQRRKLLDLFEDWRAVQFREGAGGLPVGVGRGDAPSSEADGGGRLNR
jgi:long-chain acyl-CoA synthetase